jgi:hypothetical protein
MSEGQKGVPNPSSIAFVPTLHFGEWHFEPVWGDYRLPIYVKNGHTTLFDEIIIGSAELRELRDDGITPLILARFETCLLSFADQLGMNISVDAMAPQLASIPALNP